MKDSTETLEMFAQLLEAEPSILQPNALSAAQTLAAQLDNLSETDLEQGAAIIITWMQQFPQEQKTLTKALRRELERISEPNEIQWTFPNFQIIEETETTLVIPPAPNSQPISLFVYIRQSLSRWIHKHQ